MNSIKIFSPATVANVACGFDVLGFALCHPGDEIEMRLNHSGTIVLADETGYNLPLDPEKNVTAVALQSMLDRLGSSQGFDIRFTKKIMPGSGIGSSAASSAAGVFGANELLGRPFTRKELVEFAMQGEKAASGTAHADNVAPALMGGFTLVRSYSPLDIIALPSPEIYASIVHPQIEVKTSDSRKILRQDVPMKKAIIQWGNLAGFVAGLYTSDYDLLGRSLVDVIVEPVRSLLIPDFLKIKEEVMQSGALGCSISGSGPSMFALSKDKATAERISQVMKAGFARISIESEVFVSLINKEGVRISE